MARPKGSTNQLIDRLRASIDVDKLLKAYEALIVGKLPSGWKGEITNTDRQRALKTLLDKLIPDLKAQEITGNMGLTLIRNTNIDRKE